MAELIEQWRAIFEAKEEKKDPTKLGTGEKVLGGAAIAGGLGAGAIGHGMKASAKAAREGQIGNNTNWFGKLKQEAYDLSPEGRAANTAIKAGESLGDTGLGVAGAVGGAMLAHKLYRSLKKK